MIEREAFEQHLTNSRAQNARLPFADLLRQSVYSRLAGYEDVNDAERLCHDPTFRLVGCERSGIEARLETGLALHTQAVRCKLPVQCKVKMEIPVKVE